MIVVVLYAFNITNIICLKDKLRFSRHGLFCVVLFTDGMVLPKKKLIIILHFDIEKTLRGGISSRSACHNLFLVESCR